MQGSLPGFDRFRFIAEALDATGGFAPSVIYARDDTGLVKPTGVTGPCHLIPYPRETLGKYASRCAVAIYRNHLRTACERFVWYMGGKSPQRDGTEGDAAQALLNDADYCGNSLNGFFKQFMLGARARGSMLLLVDMPKAIPATAAEQQEARAYPYLSAIAPERVTAYQLNERGRFEFVEIGDQAMVDGKMQPVTRRWDAAEWMIKIEDRIVERGAHSFGRCPVIAFTEHGVFPCFGSFEQVAVLSKRHYNASSELDEILRSQTFSLLTLQVPAESQSTFDSGKVAATIGTHNLMIHTGNTPEFIAPPDGPAQVYMERLKDLDQAIKEASMAVDDTTQSKAESGLALQMRFHTLNSALSSYAERMQDVERQVWELFAAGMNQDDGVKVQWPTDYSLADTAGELDILTAMQTTGFPDQVLREKRKQIVAAEFTNADQELVDELNTAVDEAAFEVQQTKQQKKQDPAAPPGS